MIDAALRRAVEDAVGSPLASASRCGGGSIAASYAVDFANGLRGFVKTHATLPADAFVREAEGLAWLAQTKAVHVPRVVAVGSAACPGAAARSGFLVLERVAVAEGCPADQDEERFGRELAALHRAGAPAFGLSTSNYLAVLPQDNRATPGWAEFYRSRRLEPLVARAREAGLCDGRLLVDFDRLYAVLEDRAGPPEPPARLHGDLWAGNRLADRDGTSWLIDPAVYGGHREVDLAMMRLFGGFSARAFEAYDEAYPLAHDHEERVALYQLYPLLAHLVMFGRSYLGQVEQALAAVL